MADDGGSETVGGGNSDVLIEDPIEIGYLPQKLIPRIVIDGVDNENSFSISGKKSAMPARHYTDVYSRSTRPAERAFSVPDRRTNVKATRSSMSRQGSRVWDGEEKDMSATINGLQNSDNDCLLSTTHNAEKTNTLKEMIKRSRKEIEKHKTKINVLKLKTNTTAYTKSIDALREHRIVHLTGKTGCGKTFTALEMMSNFLEEFEDYLPLIIKSPIDLEIIEDTSECLLVLADDFLPSQKTRDITLNGWKHMMKYVTALLERKRLFFIFTSDGTISDTDNDDNRNKFLSMLANATTVNLDDIELLLNDKERNKMLTVYCKHYCKTLYTRPHEIEIYSKSSDSLFGFPLLCNLVGIGGSGSLFEDPMHAVRAFISHQKEHNFSSYVLMVLVFAKGRTFTLASLQHENLAVLQKILTFLENPTCAPSDVAIALTRLKRQNVLIEEETGEISFTNDIFTFAMLMDVSISFLEQLLPFIHLQQLDSFLRYQNPNKDMYDSAKRFLDKILEANTNVINIFVSVVNDSLEKKQPENFVAVALSELWSVDAFVDSAIARFGFQLFFIEDNSATPLCSYMIRVGHTTVFEKIVSVINKQPRQIVSMMNTTMLKTLLEACLCCEDQVVYQMMHVVSAYDDSLLFAAIKSGNPEILDFLWHQQPENTFQVSREMLETACKYGNAKVFEYLYRKLEEQSKNTIKVLEIRRPNRQGDSLIHFAAQGGNDEIFEFLLKHRHDPTVLTHSGNTVLHIAAMFGRYHLVRHICASYPDLTREKNKFNFSSAFLAAREGHGDILQILVSRESNINDKVEGENTLFHIAASNGRNEILRFLFTVNPEQKKACNAKSFLPVQLAVMQGQTETVDLFISKGTDPMTRTVDRRTFLHLAAYNGQFETAKHLCGRYPNLLQARDVEGNLAAHDAAASGNVPVLKYLIEKGIDPRCQNNFGTNILHDACFNGKLETVKFVASNYPDLLKRVNENGYTVCFGAAMSGDVEVMKYIEEEGVDPKERSNEGSTCLHEAAYNNRLEMVKYLANAYPEMVSIRNDRSYMACHFAAQEGHLEAFIALLDYEDPPFPTTAENQTLLHIAAYNGQMNIVSFLCETFPEMLGYTDAEDSLVTHYAARGGHIEMLKFLIDQGLEPDARTKSGSTILHLAAYDGNTDMVNYLCDEYPHLVALLDDTGHSAAHYAAGSGELPLLLTILQHGADPLVRAGNGSSLLMKAAYKGHMDMIKFLCSENPDIVDMTDESGCNVMHYAACTGFFETIQYAIDLGLDPKSASHDGHTILHVAVFHRQNQLAKKLCEKFPYLITMTDSAGKTPEDIAIENDNHDAQKIFRRFNRSRVTQSQDSVCQAFADDVLCCQANDVLCCQDTDLNCRRVLETLTGFLCFCRK